jgi:hypothetical protein
MRRALIYYWRKQRPRMNSFRSCMTLARVMRGESCAVDLILVCTVCMEARAMSNNVLQGSVTDSFVLRWYEPAPAMYSTLYSFLCC